jgi:hypothetical protein
MDQSTTEQSGVPDQSLEDVRYDPSIFDTPFAQLPNPKRVWLGSPSSALEGIGMLITLQG